MDNQGTERDVRGMEANGVAPQRDRRPPPGPPVMEQDDVPAGVDRSTAIRSQMSMDNLLNPAPALQPANPQGIGRRKNTPATSQAPYNTSITKEHVFDGGKGMSSLLATTGFGLPPSLQYTLQQPAPPPCAAKARDSHGGSSRPLTPSAITVQESTVAAGHNQGSPKTHSNVPSMEAPMPLQTVKQVLATARQPVMHSQSAAALTGQRPSKAAKALCAPISEQSQASLIRSNVPTQHQRADSDPVRLLATTGFGLPSILLNRPWQETSRNSIAQASERTHGSRAYHPYPRATQSLRYWHYCPAPAEPQAAFAPQRTNGSQQKPTCQQLPQPVVPSSGVTVPHVPSHARAQGQSNSSTQSTAEQRPGRHRRKEANPPEPSPVQPPQSQPQPQQRVSADPKTLYWNDYEDYTHAVILYRVIDLGKHLTARAWVMEKLSAEPNLSYKKDASEGFIEGGAADTFLFVHNAREPDTTSLGWFVQSAKAYRSGCLLDITEIDWTHVTPCLFTLVVKRWEEPDDGKKLIEVKKMWTHRGLASEIRFHRAYWLAARGEPTKDLLLRNPPDSPTKTRWDEEAEEELTRVREMDWIEDFGSPEGPRSSGADSLDDELLRLATGENSRESSSAREMEKDEVLGN